MQPMIPSNIIPILLTIYLTIINLIAFSMMLWDKRKARLNDWRVSEATLLLLCFIGGAIGFFAGMFRFHHKTQKRLFQAAGVIGLLLSFYIYAFVIFLWL